MKCQDEVVVNGLAAEMYKVAADHGFHNPGGAGLDEEAKFLLALHGEISDHWEKLRKGTPVSPLDARIIERARVKTSRTTSYISSVEPIIPDGEVVDVGRMARFIVNLIGEASELWEATSEGRLNHPCDKEDCNLSSEEEEMADLAIRLMDIAVARRVNLGRAIRLKSAYNETRPFMHGKKA